MKNEYLSLIRSIEDYVEKLKDDLYDQISHYNKYYYDNDFEDIMLDFDNNFNYDKDRLLYSKNSAPKYLIDSLEETFQKLNNLFLEESKFAEKVQAMKEDGDYEDIEEYEDTHELYEIGEDEVCSDQMHIIWNKIGILRFYQI
jgi:hypothetical protein